MLKCDESGCNAVFKSQSGIWYHTQKVHEHITYKCSDCEKLFTERSSLEKHQKLNVCHQPETMIPGRYTCDEPGCEANYKNLISLTNHISSIHKKITYDCTKCGQTFTRKTSLKLHHQ